MNEEYIKINGKVRGYKTFTHDEIKSLFDSKDWERIFTDASFLESFGINSPPETFLVAGSRSDIPSLKGVIAGLCRLRIDDKDIPKGFPVNWEHWDFIAKDEKVIMVPNKKKKHWFKSEEDWKSYIEGNPPHKDKLKEEGK